MEMMQNNTTTKLLKNKPMVKCICINDSSKPKKIPAEKWIEKGKVYHVSYTLMVLPQKQLAFELDEIELDESCFPYSFFLADRFAFTEQGLKELSELIKDCTEIDMSIKELMKQTILQ